MAKRIIDIGRCLHLKKKNFNVIYQKYCDFNLTPENFTIIVTKWNKKRNKFFIKLLF